MPNYCNRIFFKNLKIRKNFFSLKDKKTKGLISIREYVILTAIHCYATEKGRRNVDYLEDKDIQFFPQKKRKIFSPISTNLWNPEITPDT